MPAIELTKENLARLRQQGMANAEIARMAGKSTSSINKLFSKYKIAPRQRIPRAKAEEMARLRKEGKSMRQIAVETGYSESAVRNRLVQEGCLTGSGREKESGCFSLPETLVAAEPEKLEAHKMRCRVKKGGRWYLVPYLDVTGLIPH